MKFIYYVKDNFENQAKIEKVRVCSEDRHYLYCGDMVLDKDQIYHVKENTNGFCRCFGYDVDLVDLQIMKYRLKQLGAKPSWRNNPEIAILKDKIAEVQATYDFILL